MNARERKIVKDAIRILKSNLEQKLDGKGADMDAEPQPQPKPPPRE